MSSSESPATKPSVLIIGATGYLGSSLATTFLRSSLVPNVYALIRRPSQFNPLAAKEITPILAPLSPLKPALETILSHSKTWDIIVTATEPSRADTTHWEDLISLLKSLSSHSISNGNIKPLILFSSGCKDYGSTLLHSHPSLQPHTEDSPIVLHPIIRGRTEAGLSVFNDKDLDATVIRATPIYGYSNSYYGPGFEYVSAFKASGQETLKFTHDKNTIIHGLHVDDCAEGYLALALAGLDDTKRKEVVGQVFNISGEKYETLEEIGHAFVREYGFEGGVTFSVGAEEIPEGANAQSVSLGFGWSQWVSSDKIRRVTGWKDRRGTFADGLRVYRMAYEASAETGVEDVERVRMRMTGKWDE
ncbi:NAD(P)-binding domain protein [Cladorrhinum sp. PSN259]|nr:NAD(P)-binding domain protein [Cladorrhinum sp. PSN259]